MRVGLLGMSGIGKSYWAARLADAGYESIYCDEVIASQLQRELNTPLSTVYDLGNWMGLPYEAKFRWREQKYLSLEIALLQKIIDNLSHNKLSTDKLVLDLTGSAIYAGAKIFQQLRQYVTIVHLAITPTVEKQMLAEYLQNPRPVIWHGIFSQQANEGNLAALERCYPKLISYREKLYENLGDTTLDYQTHRLSGLTTEGFLHQIETRLKAKPLQK